MYPGSTAASAPAHLSHLPYGRGRLPRPSLSQPPQAPPASPLHAPLLPPPLPAPAPLLLRAWLLQNGWTPLHEAALKGHLQVAQALVEAGADVNSKNNVRGVG